MHKPISITAVASISPLGKSLQEVWHAYQNSDHCFIEKKFTGNPVCVAELPPEALEEIERLRGSDTKYKALDRTVLYAIYASRRAVEQAQWTPSDNFGVNIGSSRGATGVFEHHHETFLKKGKANTLSSPTTTLGNLSSWVAHDLQTQGPDVSHSITCSTALHAVLNGVAWLQSGMCDKFLVGGSEAPLTAFTVAQMQALKIYSKHKLEGSLSTETNYPCRAMDFNKRHNTMVLGEAASMACLESGAKDHALAFITGYGYATEILEHNISISSDAKCFQRSMTMALGEMHPNDIDAIVMHAPGTIKGDKSELNAIKMVFSDHLPVLTSNKWKIGHSFGASGLLSLELAVLMLQYQKFIHVPYYKQADPKRLKNIMVNAVGFGGNAVSLVISK